MRSEEEMLALIINTAQKKDDIRAVIMNGSRVNPNALKDPFQDFDIIYLVRDVARYIRNPDVPQLFGEILIMQLPDDMIDPPPEPHDTYCYLMQFMDGNRIDLTFAPLEQASHTADDTLSMVLLDKDGLIDPLPPPSDRGYLLKPPTLKRFDDCCNEFWWLNPYVAKGLWRGELTYARHMLDVYMREELMKMLAWYHGIQTGFQKSPGKLGKYLRTGIGEDFWGLLEKTYADAEPEHSWQALFTMDELFRRAARGVAREFSFNPHIDWDAKVTAFIQQIHNLPADAQSL